MTGTIKSEVVILEPANPAETPAPGAGKHLHDIHIIGVPADLGGNRRGTDMGPSAMRYARLNKHLQDLGHRVTDHGNLEVPVPESRDPGQPTRRFFDEIVRLWHQLADDTEAICRAGGLPLILGGDHSLSVGTVAGAARVKPDLGVIWIDAHGDMNDPTTSPSGNIHGMSLAAITGNTTAEIRAALPAGLPLPENRMVMLGIRDLDADEREKIRQSGVTVFSMKDIDEQGMSEIGRRAWDIATAGGRGYAHISFDVDVLDPPIAGGVGTPVPGGLTFREAHLLMELLAERGRLASVEFSEVNPILDIQNQTAVVAVGLATSLLGKRIL
ncbi:MAG: arginase [Thermaerobacterales bacterium]